MNDRPRHTAAPADRRKFFKRVLAVAIGTVLALVPLGAGLTVFLDPLRRKPGGTGEVRVTFLEALPADGVPRKFPVLATRVDAWNKFTEVPVGAVYLRRTSDGKLEALNVVCPHAGCFVDFQPGQDRFVCPCHNSTFTVDGRIADPACPAPRAMDSLAVEVRNGKEVWVKFENFEAGRAEKVPVA
jgi:quinol---cytochrome c reductase iron-sulfur subunit, bacillus type